MRTVGMELGLVGSSGRKYSVIFALPVAMTSCVWRRDRRSATDGLRSTFPRVAPRCCRWCVSSSCVGEDGNEAKEGSHVQFLPSALPQSVL